MKNLVICLATFLSLSLFPFGMNELNAATTSSNNYCNASLHTVNEGTNLETKTPNENPPLVGCISIINKSCQVGYIYVDGICKGKAFGYGGCLNLNAYRGCYNVCLLYTSPSPRD